MKKVLVLMSVLLCLTGLAFANGQNEADKTGSVTIKYMLWDANQLPAYQQVANDFMAENPGIKIEITQMGWGDYWTGIQTDMIAGIAADVFTDHLAKFKDFASKGQLLDLEPFVIKDALNTSIYMNNLDKLWSSQDGKRYGLPKDWDTIAIVANQNMLDAAGITDAEVNNLTWNPTDGGTFEKFLAKLTLDKNGNNGLSPDFDPKQVVRNGMALNHNDDRGQAQFSPLAVSTGWMYTDGLYDSNYHFNDPKFIAAIEWMVHATDMGFLASFDATQNNANPLFKAEIAATTFDGSWMIGDYTNNMPFPVSFKALPAGPVGRRSMINGLGDSIWSGTKHPEEAWQWVKYLGSEKAQMTVGSFGVVFPAISSGVDKALAKYESRNIDISAFIDAAMAEDETFMYPILQNGVKVSEIMTQTFDKIFLGLATPKDALTEANTKILGLYK
ncbi:MAG: sugar ABC transporter substrate-binding protein [Spirochaetaceae bacterium]|nr:sugar ABC transporter substrate-binding protein [Spirochaetaceae bacterium]